MRKSNPLFSSTTDVVLVGGALVAGLGLAAWALWPKASATAPTGAALVTTPAYVQTAQSLVNSFITASQQQAATATTNPPTDPATIALLTISGLTPCTVNGTATDPTFVTDLAAVQTLINTVMALPATTAGTPSAAQAYQTQQGTPWVSLRTDGVLDGFTYQALSVLAQRW